LQVMVKPNLPTALSSLPSITKYHESNVLPSLTMS
jgi:hypothetical protein